MQINITYLPIKAHFFFYWGGVASIWSFIAVFGKQMGISEVGVGLIFTVAPIAGLIAKPVFGAIADRFKKKKMIFLFFLLLNLMSYLCIAFLPVNPPVRPVQLDCAQGQSYIRHCGHLNKNCADAILESFKPKMEGGGTREGPEENNIRSSNSVNDGGPIFYEDCTGHCEIHGLLEGIDFCHSLFPSNQPEICRRMSSPTAPSDNSTEDDKEEERRREEKMFARGHSYILYFSVKLNIEGVILEGAGSTCLFLPISHISFDKNKKKGKGKKEEDEEDEEEGEEGRRRSPHQGLSCGRQYTLKDCYMDCPNNTALNRQLETIQEEEELLDAMNFWMYGSLVVIAWTAMAVVESLADAMCFQTLGNESEKYGRQRLWGTIGWGMFQLIAGYLIDTHSHGKLLKDYTSSFYLIAGLLTIDLIVAYKWTVREVEKTKSLRRDICSVLSNLRIVVFIMACVIIGMNTGLLWSFLFWYVENLAEEREENSESSCESYQWIKLLQGLIGAIQCLGEFPFFFMSGWLIQRIGHVHCITLVLGAFGVRFILYSLISNPWMFLFVEPLQGLTYGVFYSTMVSYANKISPVGTSATVIGVVQSAFLGIGVASGSLVGGLIFHKFTGKTAFRVFGVGCLIFCAIHALVMCILDKKSNYGFPADRTEPEGQEMFKISTSTQDVADSDEGT